MTGTPSGADPLSRERRMVGLMVDIAVLSAH
jgi:hypothetical protein